MKLWGFIRRQRRSVIIATSVVAGLVVLALIVGVTAIALLNANRNILSGALSTRESRNYGAQNILLLGSDTLGSIETGSVANDPTASEGSRSDTMLLVHIPSDRRSVQVITLLRDMYVPIKDNGSGKLNWAMFFGGVPLAVDTVETLLDTKIDHVMLIDFQGIEKVSTALGGVTLDNPIAFSQDEFTFPQGTITIEGAQALAFVRGRHEFAEGDKRRVLNQQLFIRAAVDKMLQGGTLTNPMTVANVFTAIKDSMAVDEGIDVAYITELASSFVGASSDIVHFMVLPVNGEFTREPHTFWNVDQDQLAVIRWGLATDSLNLYTPPPTVN